VGLLIPVLLIPVLLDVERPFELQMRLVVVVYEFRDGLVVPSAEHARGCRLWLDCRKVSSEELGNTCGVRGAAGRHNLHFFSYSGLSVVLGEYEPYVKNVNNHFRGIGRAEGTDNHLLHLTLHAHATDDLHVLHPAQNLVLHLKAGLHAEARPLLDREGMLVQILESAGLAEVDDDVRAAIHFKAQRQDDDFAWVVGVRGRCPGADAEGFFPFSEGFVVLICDGGGQ